MLNEAEARRDYIIKVFVIHKLCTLIFAISFVVRMHDKRTIDCVILEKRAL
jgi:energy-converting hydrogenase Eha subunit C